MISNEGLAGGIIGLGIGVDGLIDNSMNTGDITGGTEAGGIVGGVLDSNWTISSAQNSGNIDAYYAAGGVVGAVLNSTVTMSQCVNTGIISSTGYFGPFYGYADSYSNVIILP